LMMSDGQNVFQVPFAWISRLNGKQTQFFLISRAPVGVCRRPRKTAFATRN
jgi:hypothetical protein